MKDKGTKNWTSDQELYLYQNYDKVPIQDIIDHTGRTKEAIRQHACQMKLTNPNRWNKWTNEDVQRLTELAQTGYTAPEIAQAINRTESAVRHKCTKLGIKLSEYRGGHWSSENLQKLKDLAAQGTSCREIAKQFGVTTKLIYTVAHKKGIPLVFERHHWTTAELNRIISLYNQRATYQQIAEELNVSTHAVIGQIYVLRKKGKITTYHNTVQNTELT